jgi:anti-anti-sigma factor
VQISSERDGSALIVAVDGRIDGSNSQEFQDRFEETVGDDERAVVLDMGKLTYISSSGLRATLLLARRLQRQQAKFAICSLSPSIKEVFEISGFDKIIPIHASREGALSSLDG